MSDTPAPDVISGPSLIDEDALVNARLAAWRPSYVIANVEDDWDFRELVVSAVRVEICRARLGRLAAYEAGRAETCWAVDRRAEAETLGAGLSRRPGLVASKLGTSKAGCEWLARRWDEIHGQALGEHGPIDAAVDRGLDLLGVPKAARPVAGPAIDADLAARERDRLRGRVDDAFAILDEMERLAVVDGQPIHPGAARDRLLREEAENLRRYERARSRLTRRDPVPVPDPPSVPPPDLDPAPEGDDAPSDDAVPEVGPDRDVDADTNEPPALDPFPDEPRTPEQWRAVERDLLRQLAVKVAERHAGGQAAEDAPPAGPVAEPASVVATPPAREPQGRLNRRARRALRLRERQGRTVA